MLHAIVHAVAFPPCLTSCHSVAHGLTYLPALARARLHACAHYYACRRSHACQMVEHLGPAQLEGFVRGWRQHFMDSMRVRACMHVHVSHSAD